MEIIIYYDNPTIPKDTIDELLKHYLQQANIVVLYFGRFSTLVFDYSEKAYASNSVFSIHARIKELIQYLKYNKAIICSIRSVRALGKLLKTHPQRLYLLGALSNLHNTPKRRWRTINCPPGVDIKKVLGILNRYLRSAYLFKKPAAVIFS